MSKFTKYIQGAPFVNRNNYTSSLLYILVTITSIGFSPTSQGEIANEFLLFPYLGVNLRTDLADDTELDSHDYEYGVDLFATFEHGNFRFLGEVMLDKREQEIERFQIGWMAGDSVVWLGRFHNPLGYWNSQYHHGSYLETSISRPAIVAFEDEIGILPAHLTGFLIEGVIEHDQQGLGYALAAAVGPEFKDELEALDILDPGSGAKDISLTLNLHYEPVLYAPTLYGMHINYTEIPADNIGFNEIHQINAGLYANWESHPWRLTGSLFYVHNSLQQISSSVEDEFFSGYVQAEYNLHDQWTIFSRIEWTIGDKNDLYLELFPGYIRDRILVGFRLDIVEHHALKLEISSNRNTQDNDFGQFTLQWDVMF